MREKTRNQIVQLEKIKTRRILIHLVLISVVVLLCFSLGKAVTIEKLLEYRNISSVKVSPEGTRAVFVVSVTDLEKNMVNPDLWLVEFSSGRVYQLTKSARSERAPAWSPDGKHIAFISNRDGSSQIWLISPEGGEAEPATQLPRLNIRQFRWLPDGSGFVFLAPDPSPAPRPSSAIQVPRGRPQQNEPIIVDKNVRHFDLKRRVWTRLYLVNLGVRKPERLTKEDYHVTSFDISPDGKKVAFSAQPAPGRPQSSKSDLKMLDLDSGNIHDLVTQPGSDSSPQFSPDGKRIAFISHPGGHSNSNIQIVRSDGSDLRNLTESFDENIRVFEWASEGNQIFFQANQRVSTKVFRMQVSTGQSEALKAMDGLLVCQSFSFGKDGQIGAAVVSDAHTPAEVYLLLDSGKSKKKLTQINEDFAELAPKTELLKYRSKDGLDLEALVIKPRNFQEGKRYPLLVIVHGGPAGVFTYGFNPRRGVYPNFAFTDQGYVLLLPNPRGSSGYGKNFRRANYQDLGGGDFRDIMQGVDLLIEKGVADPDRMGLMGWSYGGEMAYWTVTQTDRFKAVSAGAGLTNLLSFYGTNDAEGAGLELHFGTLPWKDPTLYKEHSALFFIKNAKTPLLIQHGENDVRVPLSQAKEFYMGALKVGFPVEMVVYPRQGHGIREPRLALDGMKRNLNWFNKWLLGIEPPKK